MASTMATIVTRIDELGMIVSDGGKLLFRRESGGRLDVEGCPVTELVLGQPGRLIGTIVAPATVAIERFTPEV